MPVISFGKPLKKRGKNICRKGYNRDEKNGEFMGHVNYSGNNAEWAIAFGISTFFTAISYSLYCFQNEKYEQCLAEENDNNCYIEYEKLAKSDILCISFSLITSIFACVNISNIYTFLNRRIKNSANSDSGSIPLAPAQKANHVYSKTGQKKRRSFKAADQTHPQRQHEPTLKTRRITKCHDSNAPLTRIEREQRKRKQMVIDGILY